MPGSSFGDEGGGVTGEDAQGVGGGGALKQVRTHAKFYAFGSRFDSDRGDTRATVSFALRFLLIKTLRLALKLLHQSSHVCDRPMLADFTVLESVDSDGIQSHGFTGRDDAHD
jgi:hypothetical protein